MIRSLLGTRILEGVPSAKLRAVVWAREESEPVLASEWIFLRLAREELAARDCEDWALRQGRPSVR